MSNNIFYKALAAVSTVGIVVIAGIQVTTALKKGNNAEDQLTKTVVEIKNARKDALAEVKSFRSEILKELKTNRTNTLGELKAAKAKALAEFETASLSNSSGVWLVLYMFKGTLFGGSVSNERLVEKVPMPSMKDCLKAVENFQSIKDPMKIGGNKFRGLCVQGSNVEYIK